MDRFTVIAGPCVIENEEVCFKVAETLSELQKRYPDIRFVFKSSLIKQTEAVMNLSEEGEWTTGLKFWKR